MEKTGEKKQQTVKERVKDLHQQIHNYINSYDSKLHRCRNEERILQDQMIQLIDAKTSCLNLLRAFRQRKATYMEVRGFCDQVDRILLKQNVQQRDHADLDIKSSAADNDIEPDKEKTCLIEFA